MKAFLIGLQFLTRLNLVKQTEWTMEGFGRSVLYFPLVGMVIGAFMALIWWLLQDRLSPQLVGLLLVAFEFLFTGGLHADGFMDTCDGLFSGRDRERKLEIMKDSRVGSNGVVGFVFLTLLKWQFLANLTGEYTLILLFIIPTLSRYSLTMSLRLFPYARPEGMGKAFAQYSPSYTLLVSTFWAVLLLIPFTWLYALFFGVTIALNLLFNSYITKHLGGLTGDTYGFVIELTELCLFFTAVLLGF